MKAKNRLDTRPQFANYLQIESFNRKTLLGDENRYWENRFKN